MTKPLLLVPQGAEYQAVCRGASGTPVAIAMGKAAVAGLNNIASDPPTQAILLGLGGSLSPSHRPGDLVVCDQWLTTTTGARLSCPMAAALRQTLQSDDLKVAGGLGLTSDRVIYAAAEKRALGQQYGAAVVDMEGYWVLEQLTALGVSAAVVRVISDGVEGDLPNLGAAMGPDGNLQPLALAAAMGRSPLAALRLIRGSLRGLAVLQRVAARLG